MADSIILVNPDNTTQALVPVKARNGEADIKKLTKLAQKELKTIYEECGNSPKKTIGVLSSIETKTVTGKVLRCFADHYVTHVDDDEKDIAKELFKDLLHDSWFPALELKSKFLKGSDCSDSGSDSDSDSDGSDSDSDSGSDASKKKKKTAAAKKKKKKASKKDDDSSGDDDDDDETDRRKGPFAKCKTKEERAAMLKTLSDKKKKYWEDMDPEEKKKRVASMRAAREATKEGLKWNKLSDEDKAERIQRALETNAAAGGGGRQKKKRDDDDDDEDTKPKKRRNKKSKKAADDDSGSESDDEASDSESDSESDDKPTKSKRRK